MHDDLETQFMSQSHQLGVEGLKIVPEHIGTEQKPLLGTEILKDENSISPALGGRTDSSGAHLADPRMELVQFVGLQRHIQKIGIHLAKITGRLENPKAPETEQLALIGIRRKILPHHLA